MKPTVMLLTITLHASPLFCFLQYQADQNDQDDVSIEIDTPLLDENKEQELLLLESEISNIAASVELMSITQPGPIAYKKVMLDISAIVSRLQKLDLSPDDRLEDLQQQLEALCNPQAFCHQEESQQEQPQRECCSCCSTKNRSADETIQGCSCTELMEVLEVLCQEITDCFWPSDKRKPY